MKSIRILFQSFQFWVAKFSIYLNRHVFVMYWPLGRDTLLTVLWLQDFHGFKSVTAKQTV